MILGMKKLFPLVFLSFIIIYFLPGALPLNAQLETVDSQVSDEIGIADGKLDSFITTVLNSFLGLVGIIAVVFLIMGGFQYITAAGDSNQTEKAKKTIMYAVIGLAVIGLSWAIVSFVLGTFDGTDDNDDAAQAQWNLLV